MRPIPRLPALALVLAALAPTARAQGAGKAPAAHAAAATSGRWKQIGATSVGNPIFLDQRSVKRHEGLVDATLRVQFVKPVATPKGPLSSSRTTATFDCARQLVAVKENILFLDEKKGTMFEHSVPKVPGYGHAFGGSLPAVAMAYLCAPPAK